MNKERCEIALKLRETKVEFDGFSYGAHLGESIGTPARIVSGHEMFVRKTLDRLADIIDTNTVDGNTSDGCHTFNELYHHRAVLFSVVVAIFQDKAWKAKAHHDGTMYDGMFIVGIDTPEGQATYHYYAEPYWDMFRCREIGSAPEWDGHTPSQAIERIGKLVYKNVTINSNDAR